MQATVDPPVADPVDPAPILAKAKALRDAGATIEQIKGYLATKGHIDPVKGFTPFTDTPTDTTETGGDRAAGAISSAYQGLSLGMGNKITAAADAVLPQAVGGTKGFDYSGALKQNTDILDAFRARHPLTAAALQLGGGVAGLVAAPAIGATEGLGTLPRIGVGALRGAGVGGVAGGAESVRPGATIGDVGTGALHGAEVGGVVGGAIPAAGALPVGAIRDVALTAAGSPTAAGRLAIRGLGALGKAGEATEKTPIADAAPATPVVSQTAVDLAPAERQRLVQMGFDPETIAKVADAKAKASVFAPTDGTPAAPAPSVADAVKTPEAKAAWQAKAIETLLPHRPVQLGPQEAPTPKLSDLLTQVNTVLRAKGLSPEELAGNQIGDADLAQRPDLPESNLEALLRQSIEDSKGTGRLGLPSTGRVNRP